ncbi:MAG TPA: hypothetical protein VLB80_01165 [Candidatus Babeliales bacterium]|nr:hypothetical protein [Candidatus Babeliales bacterium]
MIYVVNKLIFIVKKIVLFLLIAIVTNNVQMVNGALQPCVQEQIVTFKSLHGFPCISLYQSKKWWKALSNNHQQEVQQAIKNTNDERLLALFNVAILLPQELQKKIALELLDQNKEEVEKFLKIPISIDYSYSNAFKIAADNIYFNRLCKNNSNFTSENILILLEEIPTVNTWLSDLIQSRYNSPGDDYSLFTGDYYSLFIRNRTINNPNVIATKTSLMAIDKIAKKFQNSFQQDMNINYQFYKKFTLNNIIKEFSKSQFSALPLLLAPFISKLIFEEKCWFASIDQNIVNSNLILEKQNKQFELLNIFLKNEYIKTGDTNFNFKFSLLDQADPVKWWPTPFFYIVNPLIYLSGSMLSSISILSIKEVLDSLNSGNERDRDTVTAIFLFLGSASCGIGKCMFFCFPSLAKNPLVSIGCITGLYVFVCLIYNIITMRCIKTKGIQLEELSGLLKRTDIVIV